MDYYIGEIRIFPFSKIPSGWTACNGQQMNIQQNAALYSLLGIYYGGDAKTYFNLPKLNGKVIVGTGTAKSGTNYVLGNYNVPVNQTGMEAVPLTATNMPAHMHAFGADNSYNNYFPTADVLGNPNTKGGTVQNQGNISTYGSAINLTPLPADTITNTGGGQGHENRQPFLALVYCIATSNGIYPPRPQ